MAVVVVVRELVVTAVRAEIVEILTSQAPSLAPVLDEALAAFSGMAPTTGVVGLALLVWSASSLVRAVDGSFRVIFGDDGVGRTPIRDVVSVLAMAAGILVVAVILVVVTLPGFIGEAMGALDTMLSKIADFYDEEVDQAVANLLTLMEPVMILFLGFSVGGIIIAMYLPLFDLISKLT